MMTALATVTAVQPDAKGFHVNSVVSSRQVAAVVRPPKAVVLGSYRKRLVTKRCYGNSIRKNQ